MENENKEEMVVLEISTQTAVEMFNAIYWVLKKELNGTCDMFLDSEVQAMLDFIPVLYLALNERGLIRRKETGDFEACLEEKKND
jgi:hypothetical protein|nr:MAG TPA_asm: hypothetical protein [Caudoviricetes sp.]